mmetsp:Transcript_27369/g.65663  ORF Transcript_27369/g.65663 Transcript_27369/m.65663 type:complete len:1810 (+) Transcript_27369:69-5498(+)
MSEPTPPTDPAAAATTVQSETGADTGTEAETAPVPAPPPVEENNEAVAPPPAAEPAPAAEAEAPTEDNATAVAEPPVAEDNAATATITEDATAVGDTTTTATTLRTEEAPESAATAAPTATNTATEATEVPAAVDGTAVSATATSEPTYTDPTMVDSINNITDGAPMNECQDMDTTEDGEIVEEPAAAPSATTDVAAESATEATTADATGATNSNSNIDEKPPVEDVTAKPEESTLPSPTTAPAPQQEAAAAVETVPTQEPVEETPQEPTELVTEASAAATAETTYTTPKADVEAEAKSTELASTTASVTDINITSKEHLPPQLGSRNASVGDTQPTLVERQDSVGVKANTNGGSVAVAIGDAPGAPEPAEDHAPTDDVGTTPGTLSGDGAMNGVGGNPSSQTKEESPATTSTPPEVSSGTTSETNPAPSDVTSTPAPAATTAASESVPAPTEAMTEEPVQSTLPDSEPKKDKDDSASPMDVDTSPSEPAATTSAEETAPTTFPTTKEVSAAPVAANGDKTAPMDVDKEEKQTDAVESTTTTKPDGENPTSMETDEPVASGGDEKVKAETQSSTVEKPPAAVEAAKEQPPTVPAATVPPPEPTANNQNADGQAPPSAAMPPAAPVPPPAAPAAAAPAVPAPPAVAPPIGAVGAAAAPPNAHARPPMMGGGLKELRVEDALIYLDDVKREFGDRPRVYNEFLAIMKNFKSQEVDTPGVIQRVSTLFRGYNKLILGFNKFLPDGYKITMTDLEQMDAAYAREQEILQQQQRAMASKQQQPVGDTSGGVVPQQRSIDVSMSLEQQPGLPVSGPHAASTTNLGAPLQQPGGTTQLGAPPAVPKQLPASKKKGPAPKVAAAPAVPPPAAPPQQLAQPQQMHQAVEFDHAISYVTTIKRRFANDPSTYHSFLEILHTYQKEQRGIKEVLEQVAHLFQDHPDLLKEFTFFLPDAVQEQAKERLHRAAADSEARLAAKRAAAQQTQEAVADVGQQNVVMAGQPMSNVIQGRKRKDLESGGPTPIAFPQHPDQYVYNSAVERQFFDAAKEALATYTRDGGQAWAEFLKCMDMYSQEILSRSEMLTFVEPLLGRRNNKLFEEFKRILQNAGGHGTSFGSPVIEDAWYSVPLSEIDFSRCRKCSPSYRKLPRDYPAPPCSQRSDEEARVLNDEWVSLPVGSEESYTFRHMRRNTFEETLFRVEDERFEIDMTIDSNLCTLALLEPIAEEMAQLSQNELQIEDDKEAAVKSKEMQGLGGNLFRYTFDKNILGVIHRNSITRIYGDNGKEMLDLMEKNPTVAIPLVVKRLQQKDIEWRRVRDRLNRHWKELAAHNYYKSLDHRNLTWRTTDKRALSTRILIAEIKDRAANNGIEGDSALQARIDKAKEEHGSFYETTMACAFTRKLDLSQLPKPDRRLFTPHMAMMYESSPQVQRDAYRILSFALERGNISPADKERCHRFWTDFLGPWFHLQLNWMLSPAVTFEESNKKGGTRAFNSNQDGTDDDDSMSGEHDNANIVYMTEDPDNGKTSPSKMDGHPLPPGSIVSTVYGKGEILGVRKEDDVYVVKLPFGISFLRPSNVLSFIVAAEKSAFTTQRMVDDRTKLDRDDDMLALGTQSLYLFFRLHQILCRRLAIARKIAYEVKNDPSLQTLVEQIPGDDAACEGRRRYDAFMGLVFALLDGGTGTSAAEGGKFEDRVRSLLGHGGYELATMDKLVSHIVKTIQSMANDDTMWSLVQLFRRHLDAGGFKPDAFRSEAAFLSEGEPMYAFQFCPLKKEGGDKSVLYMEYLGVISGSEEDDGSLSDKASGSDAPPPPKRQKRGS